MKNVIQIIADQLRVMGADGLCTEECGCGLDDLAPCDYGFRDCMPARKHLLTKEEVESGEHAWWDGDIGDAFYLPFKAPDQ